MPKPIALQLYTLRQMAAKNFADTLRRVAEIGYVGVEFAGLHGMPAKDVAALLRELGLQTSSAHTAMPTRETIDAIAAEAQTLGCRRIICGTDSRKLATRADIAACIQTYQTGAALAQAHGLQLGLHNHWWEFDHLVDGKTPYESILAGVPSIFSQLDVYWCQVAGSKPTDVIQRQRARIPLLHMKDGDIDPPSPMKAAGQGKIDFAAVVAATDPHVLEWLVVELDECATDMLEAVAESYRFLTAKGLARGRK